MQYSDFRVCITLRAKTKEKNRNSEKRFVAHIEHFYFLPSVCAFRLWHVEFSWMTTESHTWIWQTTERYLLPPHTPPVQNRIYVFVNVTSAWEESHVWRHCRRGMCNGNVKRIDQFYLISVMRWSVSPSLSSLFFFLALAHFSRYKLFFIISILRLDSGKMRATIEIMPPNYGACASMGWNGREANTVLSVGSRLPNTFAQFCVTKLIWILNAARLLRFYFDTDFVSFSVKRSITAFSVD